MVSEFVESPICFDAGPRLGGVAEPRPTDGRDERWAAHREERRNQILDAAIALIEEGGGAEIHVRQIADRAGLGRPVIYRHFVDRADLDRAIQQRILHLLMGRLLPEMRLEGSIEEIIGRIVLAYVSWAGEHPDLHRIGAVESQDAERLSAVLATLQDLGALITGLIATGAAHFKVEFTDDDVNLLEPLVFGIIGQAVATVRLWLARPQREPSVEKLAEYLARSVWFQIDGHARDRGVVLDPSSSIENVFTMAVDPAS